MIWRAHLTLRASPVGALCRSSAVQNGARHRLRYLLQPCPPAHWHTRATHPSNRATHTHETERYPSDSPVKLSDTYP
eukprot:1196347-Prorocentrum_minimum.AAC.12